MRIILALENTIKVVESSWICCWVSPMNTVNCLSNSFIRLTGNIH